MREPMGVDMQDSYGQRVRRARKAQKMRQVDLARAAKVSVRTLQNIENDNIKNPHKDTIDALNETLSIEGEPELTRETWPVDVQVFLDIMGAFLSNMGEEQRLAAMRDITANIVGSR